MKRWLLAAVTVALTVAFVWLGVGPSDDGPVAGTPATAAQEETDEPAAPDAGPTERGRTASAGHGPPPWARGAAGSDVRTKKREWQQAWKQLTPRQREQTMSRLADEHAAGMRAWARCSLEGRGDCEKPLPPGLAKKQLGR